MKKYLLKVFALLAMGTAADLSAQTDALSRAETTVPELHHLNIEECVMVLNCKTEYQVDLEMRDYDYTQSQYRLDFISLQKQPIDRVLATLLGQTGDYVFLRKDKLINVIPRDRKPSTNYVFNTILPQYDVNQQNLVGAWEILCHKVPPLAIIQPVSVAIDAQPKWIAEAKADVSAGNAFSVSLRNVSVRDVVNALANKFGESYWREPYWIAQPSPESPPKWQWITFFPKDYGKGVLYKHDPGLHKQFEQLMRKKAQEYEESHPAQ